MTDRLRIVHVYNWLDPGNGGPPRVIAGLVACQLAAGHDVRLVSSDRPDDPAVDAFLTRYLGTVPPRTTVRPKFYLPIRNFPRLYRALKGADVAHLHAIWPPATLLASQVCRLLGVPYVLTPHGSLHAEAMAEKRVKKAIGRRALGYGAMVAHAAALHALNAHEAEGVAWSPAPARTVVIPNGVFPEEFTDPPPAGAFRATVPGLGEAPYVLFLSRLHWTKGTDLLGDAFAVVARARPDVHLVVCGADWGGQAALVEAARAHGYADRMHLIGQFEAPAKYGAFRDAAVYCLPSRHEGFSMAILEAMAWGRPVVITDKCHFPDAARAGAGIETSTEPGAIAAGLLGVLADPSAAEAMGARARALVLTDYTWPEISARLVELYRSVM